MRWRWRVRIGRVAIVVRRRVAATPSAEAATPTSAIDTCTELNVQYSYVTCVTCHMPPAHYRPITNHYTPDCPERIFKSINSQHISVFSTRNQHLPGRFVRFGITFNWRPRNSESSSAMATATDAASVNSMYAKLNDTTGTVHSCNASWNKGCKAQSHEHTPSAGASTCRKWLSPCWWRRIRESAARAPPLSPRNPPAQAGRYRCSL